MAHARIHGSRLPGAPRARRGNTLILTAGLLALLVILATAFLSRTQGSRVTAQAVREARSITENADVIANLVAQEISDANFVRPIIADFPVGSVEEQAWALKSANALRLSPVGAGQLFDPEAARLFGVEQRYGVDPNFPFNHAPHQVVPFTNWPDAVPSSFANAAAINGFLPPGPGNPLGGTSLVGDIGEGNPVGNPGTGDARWLRSTEPVRWSTNTSSAFSSHDAFKYWRHLTNIARADNGWRVLRDISDIEGINGFGGIVNNLNVPIEQWLVDLGPSGQQFLSDSGRFDRGTGDAILYGDFEVDWANWLPPVGVGDDAALRSYLFRYRNTPFGMPLNLWNLKNLDGGVDGNGDGLLMDWYEQPAAEFDRGTARWRVSRILSDTDGDGYTDAFWFLPPTSIRDGVRQIVSVSIVDNGGLLNANVATRFNAQNTVGETPADLALIGEARRYEVTGGDLANPPATWNVGFLDDYKNLGFTASLDFPDETALLYGGVPNQIAWDGVRWADFMAALGVANHPDYAGDPYDIFRDWRERHRYWRDAASRPLSATSALTPFGLDDEYELRMYHGQNNARIFSRFEQALNAMNLGQISPSGDAVFYDLLRSDRYFRETSVFLSEPYVPSTDPEDRRGTGQLNNAELLHDNRRKLTLYNGTRNDELPPWLRWRWVNDFNTVDPEQLPVALWPIVFNDPVAELRFHYQARQKLDLREMSPLAMDQVSGGLDAGEFFFHERLPWVLMHALTDGPVLPGGNRSNSYFGQVNDAAGSAVLARTRRLASALAANIGAYRDDDDLAPLVPWTFPRPAESGTGTVDRFNVGPVPLAEWRTSNAVVPADFSTQFLGMERQPFLTEAFIAHVYPTSGAIPQHPQFPTLSWDGQGENYVVHDDANAEPTTIVVVQIANPFPRAFDNVDQPWEPAHRPWGIDLRGYGIRVAGNTVWLPDAWLAPASEEFPTTATIYSIVTDHGELGGNFKASWLDFLDLTPSEMPPGSLLFDASLLTGTAWSMSRDPYDGLDDNDSAVELVRRDPVDPNVIVVVDRFDDPELSANEQDKLSVRLGKLDELDTEESPDSYGRPPLEAVPQLDPPVFTGIRIGNDDYWTTWVRAARPWGYDYDFDAADQTTWGIRPYEKAPRFVLGRQSITTSDETQAGDPGETDPEDRGPFRGSTINAGDRPDGPPNQGTPWFDRAHESLEWCLALSLDGTCPDADGDGEPDYKRRKPTFFNMHPVYNAAGADLYPDFFDGTYGYGRYFYGRVINDPDVVGVPDKGIPSDEVLFRAPLQMLQKDDDFQQVGELLNVWLVAHELEFAGASYQKTRRTFSEGLSDLLSGACVLTGTSCRQTRDRRDCEDQGGVFHGYGVACDDIDLAAVDPTGACCLPGGSCGVLTELGCLGVDGVYFGDLTKCNDPVVPRCGPGRLTRLGRLGGRGYGELVGVPPNQNPLDLGSLTQPTLAVPAVPAGLRILDAFVCDGPGTNWAPSEGEALAFSNARGFRGEATPGLVNVNTAPVEVMRALPQWNRLVHENLDFDGNMRERLPRSGLPEAVVSYRDGLRNGPFGVNLADTDFANGPDYGNRDSLSEPGMRDGRGLASIGEIRLLERPDRTAVGVAGNPATFAVPEDYGNWQRELGLLGGAWTASFAAREPFSQMVAEARPRYGARLRTDVVGPNFADDFTGDEVSQDAEEANLLFAGVSNLITTRSDVFTVYLRVRSFRQNPFGVRADGSNGPVWDATDPEFIVEDARYVMLVDRSGVNEPTQKPRILFFDKLPN